MCAQTSKYLLKVAKEDKVSKSPIADFKDNIFVKLKQFLCCSMWKIIVNKVESFNPKSEQLSPERAESFDID